MELNVMQGWSIDEYDIAAGVIALCGLVVIAMVVRLLKQLHDFDVSAEECRDEQCHCSNSGQLEPEETCGRCGRYCEVGNGH